MSWVAAATVAGAAISAGGQYMSASKAASAAPKTPKFNPFDVNSALGRIDYSKDAKQIMVDLSPDQQAMYDAMGSNALQYMTGGGYGGELSRILGVQAGGQIPGLFQGALESSYVDPSALYGYNAGTSPFLGGMGALFGGAGQAGLAALYGQQPGLGEANRMFGLGNEMAGRNYSDVFNQRLGLLREQAAPFEERAQNAFLTKQYGMGRMGSTGGGRDVEAFARGMSQADTTRQLDAMNLSEALYGRDLAAGTNLMGAGLQGLLSGYNARGQLGGSLLGTAGQLGAGGMNMFGAALGQNMDFNTMVNARAQQRMQNAQSLFGFGSDINTTNFATGSNLNAQQQNLINQLFQQYQAGQQAGAGVMNAAGMAQGAPAQPSPWGSVLSGFGNSVVANPQTYANLFNRSADYSSWRNSGAGGYQFSQPAPAGSLLPSGWENTIEPPKGF